MRRPGERFVLTGDDKAELVYQGALTGAGLSAISQFVVGLSPHYEHIVLWVVWWAVVGGLARLQIAISANPPD